MASFPKYSVFSTSKRPLNFQKFEQNCICQNERKLSVFGKFLSILRLARKFYVINIKKIFDWSKNEYVGIIFLQVGKLHLCKLHLCKLYHNKRFSPVGAISQNSERKPFSCSVSIILSLIFPYLGFFPASPVILLSSLLPASWLEIFSIAL